MNREFLRTPVCRTRSLTAAIRTTFAPSKAAPTRSMQRRSRILFAAGGALAGCALAPLPALSQEADAIEEVTVTGSRIRRQDFEANSPIVTVGNEIFTETNTVGVETVLNQLPQFVPAVTQFNTGNVQNTATETVGASTVSLRGLGANRNLVLINGRRGQPVNAALVVDTNSIPSSMIDRVEIISGGASAVYGADAIGGVVNFLLKDDFEGATVDARYGITDDGLNEEYQVSGLVGANLADGRGNVMLGIEYASREEVPVTEIDWQVEELNDPNVPASDFFLQETYFESATLGNYPSQAAVDAVFSELPPGTITNLSSRGRYLWINPTTDGTGTVFTGAGALASNATIPGNYRYDGPYERPDHPGVAWRKVLANGLIAENALDQWVSIPLERYSFSSNASFDFTDSITWNMEARFSKSKNNTILGFSPSALSGNAAFIPYGDEIYLDSLANLDALTGYDADGNPIFDQALLAATPTDSAYVAGGAYGLSCAPTGGCTESDAFPLPEEVRQLMDSRQNPNDDVRLNRPLDFIGPRSTQTDTTTYQLVVGLDGELDNGWFWDAYATHGETETLVNYDGFASLDRWREVVQSPNFGVNFRGQNNQEAGGQYSGIATCTSGLPVVRDFEISDDCIDALVANLQNATKLEQNTLELNLTGDAVDMPAGPLQFSVGAGYRDEAYEFYTDNLTTSESFVETALGLYPTSNTLGEFDTTELYGELLIPVVSDVPGIRQLNLELGARTSDYSTIGKVDTYKALVDWSITDWARLRGGFQRANRAPNIGELFLAPTYQRGGTGAEFGDQCSMDSEGPYSTNPDFNVNGATGAAFSRAVCEEMMGAIAGEYYAQPAANQPTTTGLSRTVGNPNVRSEEAETWTAGLVVQSPLEGAFWGGFTGSLDWYEIEITDMVALESGDAIFERCLDPAINLDGDATAPACEAIGRDPLTGLISFMSISYTNQGRALTSGVDLQLDWTGQFDFGGLSVNVLGNYNLENITQASEDADEVDWVGTRGCELGLQCMGYDYRLFTTVSWFRGPFSTSLRWRYYPEIDAGAKARDPDTRFRGVHSSYSYFALTGRYQVTDNVSLQVGIENVFDTLPPWSGGEPWRQAEDPNDYNRAPTRAGGGTYDPLGRRIFVSASVDF
ncbi:MAG: TonB-dependent receptor [Gammaproteobacteria bacterium]|nr:TonB-dependent receptor [Gammaproteobacteria bacterium]